MNEEQFGILIVDDEPSVRDSLYHWFRKDGFRVGAAESAHAALERFKTDDSDQGRAVWSRARTRRTPPTSWSVAC